MQFYSDPQFWFTLSWMKNNFKVIIKKHVFEKLKIFWNKIVGGTLHSRY